VGVSEALPTIDSGKAREITTSWLAANRAAAKVRAIDA